MVLCRAVLCRWDLSQVPVVFKSFFDVGLNVGLPPFWSGRVLVYVFVSLCAYYSVFPVRVSQSASVFVCLSVCL